MLVVLFRVHLVKTLENSLYAKPSLIYDFINYHLLDFINKTLSYIQKE